MFFARLQPPTPLAMAFVVLVLGSQNGGRAQAQAQSGAASLKRMEWKVGEGTREALVALPTDSSVAAPVVFVWHGHGGTMAAASRSFAIHKLWPEAIVVYPQGLPTPGLLTDPEGKKAGWQHFKGEKEGRDLQFFDAMLETFKKTRPVDPRRIYATGHSNGGRFTYLLWATRPEVFAAVAPSASTATGLLTEFKPKPCLHVAGEQDRLVKFELQKQTMRRVREINGVDAEGQPLAQKGSGQVTLYPSKTGTPFISAIYPGGHGFAKEAPQVIVTFFKEQTGP